MVKNLKPRFESILLIDDAVGSGATLNETAKKLKVAQSGWNGQKIDPVCRRWQNEGF